ncbi:nuclear pore complex protein Nup93 [Culex quinquefasciatus]|uniref:Nuclear pore protein n=1 Tax=Culex quinquefasciatus TaxID=7176 RepID=B0WEZ2_CULQU|nr:nuclear pore complex protein Nup93 [Culex quinquefasciatus]|eukprot:XP_001847276.1 nuclear pore complex protein Nup93 [Culex quinquefasciatus]
MDFSALLQQAQKLTHETQVSDDLPRVERTLPQVLQATQELHSRVSQTGAQDMQAHILLGHKGIDLPKISQKLETLSSRKTFEPLDPISTTDIQSFLRNEKENAILSVIEEVHKNSFQAAQNAKWEHTMNDWKLEKVKLMNALIGPSQNWIDIRKGPEQTILNESTFGGRSSLNNQEMAYAREVYEYNKLINEGAMRPSLVQRFAQVADGFNDSKVGDIWEIMKYMTNVTPSPRTQDPLRARCTQTQFIEQAKRYLENRYKLFMQTVIAEHLRDAQRGGIPSILNLVGSFVGLKFANQNQNSSFIGLQDGHVDGKPLWPMVYYCLRCGDIASALKCMQMAGPGHDDFIAVLEEKCRNPGQKINPKLELQIRMQYKRQIRNAIDPYKRVVYCIIGCCDIQEQHPEVAKSSDDFLWIQLSLIRPESDDNSEHLTYSGLQAVILEQYGERHFNATEQPHLYYQVLALTGQFEAGIEFLSRFDKFRAHAVHIALALSELHMIGGPRNLQEPLLSVDIEDPQPMRRLNIARLIMLYVKKFEITDPAEALQYFFFLRNLRDSDGRNLFLVCVSDLAIECRDFDLLFGKMQRDGIRSRGLIDQFESSQIDAKMACEMIAEEFVRKGMFEDAIRLFDLAGIHEQALRYTSILLSQVVHQANKPGSLRERLQRMALEFTERYAGAEKNCDPPTWSTFTLLKELMIFFDQYHCKNYQPALEVLERTKLVPLKMHDLEACVHNFKRLGGEVCKVIPDLLLATMDIAYCKYKALRGKDVAKFDDAGREQQLNYLREQAKALTNMAATVPYRMPGDTNNRLVQTEILMH